MVTSKWSFLSSKAMMLGVRSLGILSFSAAVLSAQAPTLNLPSTVTAVQSITTSPSTFNLVITGVGGGLSLTNTTYTAWCTFPNGLVPSEDINLSTLTLYNPSGSATYNVYSSYATYPTDQNTGVPGGGLTSKQEWQLVNYVLNYPKGKSGNIATNVNDEQAAIWQLLHPTDGINYLAGAGTDSAAASLYNDAITYGLGFVPGSGQVVAVILDPQTPAAIPSNQAFQGVLIAVPLSGGITIVKTANVSAVNCFQKVVYSYVVTNTGNIKLDNVVVTDDNGTPNYDKDDFVAGTVATLAPGQSATFSQSVYLPITQYAVDSAGNSNWSTMIPKGLPNGDYEITFLEDDDLKDNTYGSKCAAGWKTQGGKGFWDNVGSDYAEFQFLDGHGNAVLDFDADYFSCGGAHPSGFGTSTVHNGSSGWHGGSTANLAAVTTTMSDNMNKAGKFYGATTNSPDSDRDWECKSAYKVSIHAGAFGWNGFGGCKIKNVSNGRCKTGGGHYTPQPVASVVTNIAVVKATVDGSSKTVTAKASASVNVNIVSVDKCPVTVPTIRQQDVHKCQQPHQVAQQRCSNTSGSSSSGPSSK